jgi:hypothetical protein
MHSFVANIHLGSTAAVFFSEVVQNCPGVFREREVHWQIKMLSRYAAERDFFDSCLSVKESELSDALPLLTLSQHPPSHSIPFKVLSQHHSEGWPNIVSFLSQIYLQQILSSSDLFLDLGSQSDAFFVVEEERRIVWVPEPIGARWHAPFRQELAKLYLGWIFEQERLLDTSLLTLHMMPLKNEILRVLSHWRGHESRTVLEHRLLLMDVFLKAEFMGLRLHPNALLWGLYELEVFDVLAGLHLRPDLEKSADELCRARAQISA